MTSTNQSNFTNSINLQQKDKPKQINENGLIQPQLICGYVVKGKQILQLVKNLELVDWVD
jgi:hypothetical protein